MSNLSATVAQYEFTPTQANAISAPLLGQYFAEQDVLYSRDNASLKAHYGTSNEEQITYDAANRQFFNDTLELGLDCGRANTAAGRPNGGVNGAACYAPSISATRAAKQMNANYNNYQPTAEQVVLAEGDIRYAPARYVDQNNYAAPSISDFSFNPRLMGTRDFAGAGCSVDTEGNIETCALADDPLPYSTSADPRTSWGVDEPRSQYWDDAMMFNNPPGSCTSTNSGQYPDNWSEMCNLNVVEPGGAPNIPVQYSAGAKPSSVRARINKRN